MAAVGGAAPGVPAQLAPGGAAQPSPRLDTRPRPRPAWARASVAACAPLSCRWPREKVGRGPALLPSALRPRCRLCLGASSLESALRAPRCLGPGPPEVPSRGQGGRAGQCPLHTQKWPWAVRSRVRGARGECILSGSGERFGGTKRVHLRTCQPGHPAGGGEQDRVSEYPSRLSAPSQGSGVCTRTPCESHLGGSSPTALLWQGCGGPKAALPEVFAASPLFSLLESQAG